MAEGIRNYRSGLVLGVTAVAAVIAGSTALISPASRADAHKTPAATASVPGWQARIVTAEEKLRLDPENVSAYHALAVAQMRAQRETGDELYHRRAEETLLRARRQKPVNYETEKLLAWVLAGQHRFDEAAALARKCVQRNPHDYWNYGVIGDALTETGDYPAAVAAVQKMVDLRPGAQSYARAANLRLLHGDPDGALELYRLALEATSPRELEAIAWVQTQIGEVHFLEGDLRRAESAYTAALQAVPSYYLALPGQARVLAASGKLQEAAATYKQALKQVEQPAEMAALGDVYLAMGDRVKAEAQYRATEEYLTARLDDPTADARHALAEFLADRGRKPEKALRLAREEASDAQDIKALDTLSWALYHAGDYQQAWSASQRARRLGTRHPKLLYHAGMIALRLPDRRQEGARLLDSALSQNPRWDVLEAPAARRALAEQAKEAGRRRL